MAGSINRRIVVQAVPEKITTAKRTGDVAQAVELLPSTCEALSSHLSTVKKTVKRMEGTLRKVYSSAVYEQFVFS
jgi:hypothetical protein